MATDNEFDVEIIIDAYDDDKPADRRDIEHFYEWLARERSRTLPIDPPRAPKGAHSPSFELGWREGFRHALTMRAEYETLVRAATKTKDPVG